MQRTQWNIDGQPAPAKRKLPYVSTWKTFSKLPDDEKEQKFNAMRAELIEAGRMEESK